MRSEHFRTMRSEFLRFYAGIVIVLTLSAISVTGFLAFIIWALFKFGGGS